MRILYEQHGVHTSEDANVFDNANRIRGSSCIADINSLPFHKSRFELNIFYK